MKIKVLSVLLFSLIFAGCSTTQSSSPKLPKNTKYLLGNLKVNLTQKLQVSGYPDNVELTKIVNEKIVESLKKSNLLGEAGAANTMSVSIDINYKRRFAGEDTPIPSKSVMAPLVGYTMVITENGVEKSRVTEELVVLKGAGGNMLSALTLGLGKDAKDEVKDIESFADFIAGKLKNLRD